MMGTADMEAARMILPTNKPIRIDDETPAHRVTFKQPFLLGQTEITQQQWLNIMHTKPGPAAFWKTENWQKQPVVSISWKLAQDFIRKLNQLDSQFSYRLPTEAEWEYAARAGSNGQYPWPQEELEQYAWFIHNSGDQPQVVASLKANAFGLYDIIGNAWEWVDDWYAADRYQKAALNPSFQLAKGSKKIRRGGSYHCPLHMIRVAYRAADTPDTAYSVIGFRLLAESRKP
ncbi:MAG: formylglycine-generating enzyme family protein [gamma proteobacterium symbiont of Bathyaustriella thionipta]|nr:formylglycine-generating enzyme family protein [gamma proteobacterium symbiont of Bathyaustriella thionipta]